MMRSIPIRQTLSRALSAGRRHLGAAYGTDHGVAAQGLLRGLGMLYVFWFWSFAAQAAGLCGTQGLTPFTELLGTWRHSLGTAAIWQHPTLLWLGGGDVALLAVAGIGALAGLLLLTGLWPWGMVALAWICQISLTQVAPLWLGGPGDALLAEIGFFALLLASPRWRWMPPPSEMADRRMGLVLLNAVLFKLMFGAGLAKLADPLWRNGNVLFSFFETQPLPTVGGWFFHFLPETVLTHALWGVMFIELALPFYLLLPRVFRTIAAGGFALHALLTLAAGNPGFTAPLLLLLAFTLVDDVSWRKILPAGWGPAAPLRSRTPKPAWPVWILLLPIILLPTSVPAPWRQLADWLRVFRSVHTYEVHTRVPVQRLEIAFQGSMDGRDWREYRFKQKPSDPRLLPVAAFTHHPRLDEQLALAARPPTRPEAAGASLWIGRLATELLRGNPYVLGLLADNPFPNAPPNRLRLVVYEYRFADPVTHRRDKVWWQRQFRALYAPVLKRE